MHNNYIKADLKEFFFTAIMYGDTFVYPCKRAILVTYTKKYTTNFAL